LYLEAQNSRSFALAFSSACMHFQHSEELAVPQVSMKSMSFALMHCLYASFAAREILVEFSFERLTTQEMCKHCRNSTLSCLGLPSVGSLCRVMQISRMCKVHCMSSALFRMHRLASIEIPALTYA
jgi:hypothetical protein